MDSIIQALGFVSVGVSLGILIGYTVHRILTRPRASLPSFSDDVLEEPQSTEADLSRIFKVLGDAVIQSDPTGLVCAMNPAAERLTGWSLKEAMGKPVQEVARLQEPPPNVSQVGGMFKMMMVRARGGAIRWVVQRRSLLTDENRRLKGTVLILRDVSRERRTLEELHMSRRNFQEVIRKTPYGVAIFREGRFVYVNPKWAATLGYSASKALIGQPIEGLLDPQSTGPEDLRFFNNKARDFVNIATSQIPAMLDAAEGEKVRKFRFVRKDGQAAIMEISPVQIIRFDRAPASLVVARDITEIEKMQTQLVVADRMVSVGTLAAGVAHEINNPLAYVIANLDYLDRCMKTLELDDGSREDFEEVIGEAREGAERVRLIVRDLKTFSRSDDERRDPLDVHQVLESAIKMARTEIRHRAQLERTYGDVKLIEANEARLGQVFLNLLLNATQAIPEGEVDQHKISIQTHSDKDWTTIEIGDTGKGIESDDLARIFDPFFTTKPVGVGTGLGLSICHNIIVSMGGRIDVESVPGAGTTFRISLPATLRAPRRQITAPLCARNDLGPRGRILVVDDDEGVSRAIGRALGTHDVTIVSSGRDAIQSCENTDYDLILCDLMMPEVTGMDLHARLKVDRPELAEKMIFITGGAFTDRAKAFIDGVPNTTLDKPFDPGALKVLIKSRLMAAV